MAVVLFIAILLASVAIAEAQTRANGSPPSDLTLPIQHRMAWTATGMTVSWTTYAPVTGGVPSVTYSLSPALLNTTVVSGVSTTYNSSLTWFHHVTINGLAANTVYFYQPINDPMVWNFTTALAVGDRTPYSVIIYGDLGLFNSSDTTAAIATNVNDPTVQFVLHTGDLGYADEAYYMNEISPVGANWTYNLAYETWMDSIANITQYKPYMTVVGNHESVCDFAAPPGGPTLSSSLCPANVNNFTVYNTKFRMPSADSGGVLNMWYSFNVGLVHFVIANTETDFPSAPDISPTNNLYAGPFGAPNQQLNWLINDLSHVNRTLTPFVVVSVHRPWYVSTTAGDPTGLRCLPCQAAFEPIFNQYGVDLVFTGHKHWYERTYPLMNFTVLSNNYTNPPGPVYVLQGAAGHIDITATTTDYEGGVEHPPATSPNYFTALWDIYHRGWGKLFVNNASSLTWQYYQSNTSGIIDQFTITKTPGFVVTATTPVASAVGDPVLSGLRGQKFQVHGIDGEVYNIISHSGVGQVNVLFAYLSGPRKCPIMPTTGRQSASCWSHPGSYLTAIGVQTADGHEIEIAAGSADKGFKYITVDGRHQIDSVNATSTSSAVTLLNTHEMVVIVGGDNSSWQWHLTCENIDGFINIRTVTVKDRKSVKSLSDLTSHGLLGQTWNTKTYDAAQSPLKVIEGQVDDYLIQERSLFGNDFIYNQFTRPA